MNPLSPSDRRRRDRVRAAPCTSAARFPQTGPVKYTMTARHAIQLCRTVRPRSVIPVHYEGWSHFKKARDGIEHDLSDTDDNIRQTVHLVTIGEVVDLTA
jgi:L-ascorbate metabolism protein UlaG (beta-lactamase superfamily)